MAMRMTFEEWQARKVRKMRKLLESLYRDITELHITYFEDGRWELDDEGRHPIPDIVGSEEIAGLVEQISPLLGKLQKATDNLQDCR
jgi:hypothetical protein